MRVTFYGSRGSLPTPVKNEEYLYKLKNILEIYRKKGNPEIDPFIKSLPHHLSTVFGGNTACVSLENQTGDTRIIFDAGSGLRELGKELASRNHQVFHIFLSHFHWDHICGIPFFKPVYNPTNTFYFYSPSDNLLQNLRRQQHPHHFPVSFAQLPAKKKFVIMDTENPVEIGTFSIRAVELNHPGGCWGYVADENGKRVSYLTDTEFTDENMKDRRMYYKACFDSSDLLIMDCQYSLVEFFGKFDWGHTASSVAVNLALEWRAKKLALFHFDPDHTDEDLSRMLSDAEEQKTHFNKRKLDIVQAIEGSVIEI
jgi:phosphoribosyl 1,2-cyclic phosphodiesterase